MTRPVEFVDQGLSWCPLAAVILGGQKMQSLDLRTSADQQRFGEVLVENEIGCPRCFFPHSCELESINFARVVCRISCKRCGFRFRWYATGAAWRVHEEPTEADWMDLLLSELEWPEQQDSPPPKLRELVADLRCAICRERLLTPIRFRRGLVRTCCRNSNCRQQWGFNPEQLLSKTEKTENTPVLVEAA
jgi:hypothetical protein